jgi:molybdopterin synthase sulfur carrier subunit
MATLFVPTQLRESTGGLAEIQATGATLRDLLRDAAERHPRFVDRVLRDGEITPGLAVAIDGAMTNRGLLAVVKPDSEVHFLPAIGAG